MLEGVDVADFATRFCNQDPDDPYTFDGVSYAPRRYMRIFCTEADVVKHLQQAKITRRMTDLDISKKAGVDVRAVERLVNEGKGTLDCFMAVLDSLGIVPLRIPTSIVCGE